MRRTIIAIALAALTAAIALPGFPAGPAREDFSGLIYADPDNYPIAHIEPFHYKQFSMMEREMQYLIYVDGDHRITNHFCVVGYRLADGRTETVVIWKEKNLLFPWGGGDPEAARERFRRAFSLAYSKRIGEENLFDRYPDEPPYVIGGDKLAMRPNFYATLADCERHGTQHRIYPFVPPADEED